MAGEPHTLAEARALFQQAGCPPTPAMLLDLNRVRLGSRRFLSAFQCEKKVADVYFAVKANPHPAVLRAMADEGCCFDVASWVECEILIKELKVDPKKLAYSAPAKVPSDIKKAFQAGVSLFAVDCECEVKKLATLAPGCGVLIRLAVEHTTTHITLGFGASIQEAVSLGTLAVALGLQVRGLAFHVGSQNTDKDSWANTLKICFEMWNQLSSQVSVAKIPEIIDIGGGFPAFYKVDESIPTLSSISASVLTSNANIWCGTSPHLIVEPGRALSADCVVVVASVISVAIRKGKRCVYLDIGVYNGVSEALPPFNIRLPILIDWKNIEASQNTRLVPSVLCGPTSDSTDVINPDVMLPDSLEVGDRIFLCCAGAYSFAMQRFNGFEYPPVILL